MEHSLVEACRLEKIPYFSHEERVIDEPYNIFLNDEYNVFYKYEEFLSKNLLALRSIHNTALDWGYGFKNMSCLIENSRVSLTLNSPSENKDFPQDDMEMAWVAFESSDEKMLLLTVGVFGKTDENQKEKDLFPFTAFLFGEDDIGSMSDIIDALQEYNSGLYIPVTPDCEILQKKEYKMIARNVDDLERNGIEFNMIGCSEVGIMNERLGELGKKEFEELHNYYVTVKSRNILKKNYQRGLEHRNDEMTPEEKEEYELRYKALLNALRVPEHYNEEYLIIKAHSRSKAAELLYNSFSLNNAFSKIALFDEALEHYTQKVWDMLKDPSEQMVRALKENEKDYLIDVYKKTPMLTIEYSAKLWNYPCDYFFRDQAEEYKVTGIDNYHDLRCTLGRSSNIIKDDDRFKELYRKVIVDMYEEHEVTRKEILESNQNPLVGDMLLNSSIVDANRMGVNVTREELQNEYEAKHKPSNEEKK